MKVIFVPGFKMKCFAMVNLLSAFVFNIIRRLTNKGELGDCICEHHVHALVHRLVIRRYRLVAAADE